MLDIEKLLEQQRKQEAAFDTSRIHLALRQALQDLRSCEASGRYKVDMSHFHLPYTQSFLGLFRRTGCKVCLAGAVMAKRLGAHYEETATPSRYTGKTKRMLFALDYLREVEVVRAVREVYPDLELDDIRLRLLQGIQAAVRRVEYEEDTAEFHHQMGLMADLLEFEDL